MTSRIAPSRPPGVTLSDLLPALRWSDPIQVGPMLDDARLPQQWWDKTLLADAVATVTGETVAYRAALALRAIWPHLTLDAALPNLCFCAEGQNTDLQVTVQETVMGMPTDAGDEAIARMIAPLLRPFSDGGRSLAQEAPKAGVPDLIRADKTQQSEALSIPALADALLQSLPQDAPVEVREAAERLRTWASSVAPQGDACTAELTNVLVETGIERTPLPAAFLDDPISVLNGLLSEWDQRQLTIAAARTFGDDRLSLDALGAKFSVTRERVRQLQVGLEKRLQEWLASTPGKVFRSHLLKVQELLGSVALEAEISNLHPSHALVEPKLGIPFWEVIAALLPGSTRRDNWVSSGDLEVLMLQTRRLLSERCHESVPTWDEAVEILQPLGIRAAIADEWIQAVGGFRILDGQLLTWGRSVNERAESVLALLGEPMSPEGLLSRLNDGTALTNLRNQLSSDGRFIRRDRARYGLRKWGGREYLGIRDMIVRELEASGGRARIGDIADTLSSQFGVADVSVRAYMANPEFDRSEKGWIKLSSANEDAPSAVYEPRRDVAETRRCFQTGQGTWWYRLDVNSDHLRGSGFPIPVGFAVHLGLAPGGRSELSHENGDISLSWTRNQPNFGSIRPLLEHMSVEEGDHVFVAAKDGRLKALRLAKGAESDLTDLQHALRLMALSGHVATADMPSVLGKRIGLNDATTMGEVISRLRTRGDRDILELLAAAGVVEVGQVSMSSDEQIEPISAEGPSAAEPLEEPALAFEAGAIDGDPSTAAMESGAPSVTAAQFRDPAWDKDVFPWLDADAEAELRTLATAVADRYKCAPVFGFELGNSGWQADFAWEAGDVKVAVLPTAHAGVHTDSEIERRDAAYRGAGWAIGSPAEWLALLPTLLSLLPDAVPES